MNVQEILTPQHWAWRAFIKALTHVIERRGCTGDFEGCELLLKHPGFTNRPDFNADETLRFFEHHGAFCDCEVLMNVGDEAQ